MVTCLKEKTSYPGNASVKVMLERTGGRCAQTFIMVYIIYGFRVPVRKIVASSDRYVYKLLAKG